MLRNGNSGLKWGSLARHIPNMHTCKYPPPGTNMKQIGYGTPKKLVIHVIICLPQPHLSILYST